MEAGTLKRLNQRCSSLYDPRVLEQLALLSHTGEEALHSSMSRKTKILEFHKDLS